MRRGRASKSFQKATRAELTCPQESASPWRRLPPGTRPSLGEGGGRFEGGSARALGRKNRLCMLGSLSTPVFKHREASGSQ